MADVTAVSIPHCIAGTHTAGRSDRHADVFDPATGTVTKRVPRIYKTALGM